MTTSNHDQPTLAAPDGKVQDEWKPSDPMEPPERQLLHQAAAWARLDFAGDSPVDHQAMDGWGPARTVRAAVLRHLLVEPQWRLHSKGVRLRGARISGRLDLESTEVRCPLLLADCYFDSPEPVTLDYATASRIVLARCRVAGGLAARLLVVAKELDLSGSAFEGAVWLAGADITGRLSCRGAQLTGKDAAGNALNGEMMTVGGHVLLGQVSTTAGAIRLLGADITGGLSCSGAKLSGKDAGNALVGSGMKVGGDVLLDQGFTAAAAVHIAAAQIDGSLSLRGAQLAEPAALLAGGLRIGNQLQWAPRSPVSGLVDLELARVHRLEDDWSHRDNDGRPDAYWPPAEELRLAGFTYDEFGGENQASWKRRRDWIRRSHRRKTDKRPAVFAAQPYEQLARVHRQAGQESDARQVAIARRSDLRRLGTLTRTQKLGNWLLDKTIKHGYQPLRAVLLLVVVYLFVLVGALSAQHHYSVIVPAKSTKDIDPVPTAMQCSPGYPCFYPAGYAVDVVVPIINLRQAENWRVDGQASWGWAYLAVGWVATGLGWAFTTLAVAGYTGLVRKE